MVPSTNSQDHFNYKSFLSLNNEAVGDYRDLFLDVECRWPGSVEEWDTCSSNEEVVFNNLLCIVGNPVECTFGRLKPHSKNGFEVK